ncbi:hypothetical protein GGR42_000473 [Saonia flava]|uniref:Outer membrane protein beta-barrel domain-containing protein n=1 Tax=Saonia flava TaxID=523696 RepID=A0A846QPL9_9FLAO|nr:outer membrane beta-barrel protein [Saonia flava]NJB70011.1 hypothetical protein [Saonia flava]
MNKYLFLAICLLSAMSYGQILYSDVGQTISSFEYKNSSGGSLENLQKGSNTYMGAGYAFQLPGDKAHIMVGGVFTNYSAMGSDVLLDNFYEWDLSYLGLQTGLWYNYARSRDFVFFAKLSASMEYLLRGTQTLNNQVFDLTREDEFDNLIVVPRLGLGIEYPISNKAALFVQYQYGRSFSLVNSNPNDNEKLNISNHNFGMGIIIQLPGCNCSF